MTPRFDLIGLAVNDMSASLAFYGQLGIDIPEQADDEPHVEVTLPGGLRLAWDTIDTIRSFDPEWTPRTGNAMSLAFACDTSAEVDELYASLVRAGYPGHKEPWDAVWGQRYAIIHDPDGNDVDLFAPLPASS